MSLHLSKCHIVGNQMSRLIFDKEEIKPHIEGSLWLIGRVLDLTFIEGSLIPDTPEAQCQAIEQEIVSPVK